MSRGSYVDKPEKGSCAHEVVVVCVACDSTNSLMIVLDIIWRCKDPKSSNEDVRGLALIVANAIKKQGINTKQLVEALKKSRPELTAALTHCGEVYNTVVTVSVSLTINALKLGNPKFAEDGMADTDVEAQSCEKSFGEHGRTSPMTELNKAMEYMANIARAIIRMLL